jgi:hypothetical protein
MQVHRISIETVAPMGGLEIYGVGLFNAETGDVTQVRNKAKYHLVYGDAQIRVFENTAAMPRAFLVERAVVAPPGRDALSWMQDTAFDPHTMVALEGPGALPPSLGTQMDSKIDGGARPVDALSYSAEAVTVRATSGREAFLVLTDPYFPGWVARLDGKPTPMLRADYLFRAVVVPPGTHTVTFAFEPGSIALGAIVSLLAFGVVLVVAAGHALASTRARMPVLCRPAVAVPESPASPAPGLS